MSNPIANVALSKANQISSLLMEDNLVVDLTKLIAQLSTDFLIGYYFEDPQGKIISGRTVDFTAQETESHQKLQIRRVPRTWLSIPRREVPQNAVTISFFTD